MTFSNRRFLWALTSLINRTPVFSIYFYILSRETLVGPIEHDHLMTHSEEGIGIVNALQTAHEATSQEVLNNATYFIEIQSQQPGYVRVLIELINQYDVPINLTLAALAQLKVFLTKAWPTHYNHPATPISV
jgi:hypothetical protein